MIHSKISSLRLGAYARRLSLTAMVLAATFAGHLYAQDFEGKNITEVAIRYRDAKTVDEARIRNLMSTKAGSQYRAESLDNDIKTLFESGLVDDVRFLAEPDGAGVRIITDILTRPTINVIRTCSQRTNLRRGKMTQYQPHVRRFVSLGYKNLQKPYFLGSLRRGFATVRRRP